MKCEAERCSHEAMFVVAGPGKTSKLCGCCGERVTRVAVKTGTRVVVTDLNGVEPCAIPVHHIDFESMSDLDLVELHDLVHDALELRAASKKRGLA